jgi:hypothetical protein
VVKNFFYGFLCGLMILTMVYVLFDGAAHMQELRESKCEKEIASCTTGQHCRVMGRDLLTITARGAK